MKALKKSILITISLIALISLIASCNKYNHVYRESLNGDVKSVELEIFDANIDNGDIMKGNLRWKYIKMYDKKGYTTLFENYLDETELRYSFIYNANDDRSVIEVLQKYSDNDFSKQIVRMKNNRPISMKFFYKDKYEGEIIYYTEDNRLFVGIGKNADGKVQQRVIEEFDNGNNITSITYTDEVYSIYCRYYDKKNYKIAKIINKTNSRESIQEFFYDDSGKLERSINCSYDEIAGSFSDGSSKNFYYKYDLDANNNWIKCIVYEEGSNRPVFIKERKITYY